MEYKRFNDLLERRVKKRNEPDWKCFNYLIYPKNRCNINKIASNYPIKILLNMQRRIKLISNLIFFTEK